MPTIPNCCRRPCKMVDVTDPASEQAGIDWWTELTSRGGEGMVVKPLDFVFRGKKGLVQPAVKCRGREYLRIIYGPDYTSEENLAVCGHVGWAVSDRWPFGNSHSASRRWSDSCATSRCAGSTSASSASWHWRANRWTRGCKTARSLPTT